MRLFCSSVLGLVLLSHSAYAEDYQDTESSKQHIGLSGGHSFGMDDTYEYLRLSYLHDLTSIGDLEIILDSSLSYWNNSDGVSALSITPLFRYNIHDFYVDLGIGASVISDYDVGHTKLGGHFQFEDRLGLGYRMNEATNVGVNVFHYSNGGINSENDGANFITLSLEVNM